MGKFEKSVQIWWSNTVHGKQYRVRDINNGKILLETNDEEEARAAMQPGLVLEQLYIKTEHRWRENCDTQDEDGGRCTEPKTDHNQFNHSYWLDQDRGWVSWPVNGENP